jgi:predicted nucleic acid-binding protein
MTARDAGIVILDTNVLKSLLDANRRVAILGSLRAANLQLRLSAVNVAEVVPLLNERTRAQLLALIAELSETVGLYPLTFELLRLNGQSVVDGADGFWLTTHPLESNFLLPGAITPQWAARIEDSKRDQIARWSAMYANIKSTLKPYLVEQGDPDPWGSVPAFLDKRWSQPDLSGTLVEVMWKLLKLDGTPPPNLLEINEAWRIHFEGMGADYYEKTISKKTARPTQPNDLAQLAFMSLGRPRILVTEDKGLHRVAQAVTRGRYPDTRVMWARDFIESADKLASR